MQPWQAASLGAAAFIALHYMLVRAASGKIGDALGALLLEAAAALGIGVSFFFGLRGEAVATTRQGVVYSVLSGLGISVASILLFFALRRGGPVASTGTLVLGGGVTLSAIVAPWIFGEPWTARRALGVALGVAGMFVLATESRE
jgi:multidrug transporter EmrE-like cation transporter